MALRLWLTIFSNVLSGCVKTGADGQPTGEGFVYNFLVLPMSNAITYLVDNFNGTMVGRLFLSPLLYGSLFYR